jgi:ribosome-binding factor A
MVTRQSRTGWIKRNQKQSLLYKEISKLIQQASLDDSELTGFYISKVELSDNKSNCFVFFFSDLGEEHFRTVFKKLVLYKPSLRAALAKKINSRRVPQITFKYDTKFATQREVEELIESIKTEE